MQLMEDHLIGLRTHAILYMLHSAVILKKNWRTDKFQQTFQIYFVIQPLHKKLRYDVGLFEL